MKLVYTHENPMLVSNAQNILENLGIPTMLKNEFAGGGSGDLSFLTTWPELWVMQDEHYSTAVSALENSLNQRKDLEWICDNCHETNEASFEICWNCQSEQSAR